MNDKNAKNGETPSQTLINKAAKPVSVKDARGRTIVLRKPPVLAQFHLIEALGKTAANQTYLQMVVPLLYVTKVDDIDVLVPNSKTEVEALIQMLDEDGLNAVLEGVTATFGITDATEQAEKIKK